MSRLSDVLATAHDDLIHSRVHVDGWPLTSIVGLLERIEAAARVDHPEDFPPKDGEVRNAAVDSYNHLTYQFADKGVWHHHAYPLSEAQRTALHQLAAEGKL